MRAPLLQLWQVLGQLRAAVGLRRRRGLCASAGGWPGSACAPEHGGVLLGTDSSGKEACCEYQSYLEDIR